MNTQNPGAAPQLERGDDDSYKSQHEEQIAAARAAGNTFEFEGRELEMYVARGEASVATAVMRPGTDDETGALLVHHFSWENADAFVARENSFWTSLSRVGRRTEQKVKTAHQTTVNSEFYRKIVAGGTLKVPKGNNQFDDRELSREEMIEHSNIYPESASEAIESWLDAPKVKVLTKDSGSFEFLFTAQDVTQVLWHLGPRDNPTAAVVFSFNAPSAEERKKYDESVQSVDTKRSGDVSTTHVEESFQQKIKYGTKHLVKVEGAANGSEGVQVTKADIPAFITRFNPIWFGDVVETMHASFDFMKGRSAES